MPFCAGLPNQQIHADLTHGRRADYSRRVTSAPSPLPVFRFAPSPNGELHLGHAYSAMFSEREARKTGGRLLLRIEDIDTIRCRPVYAEHMIEDLAWLGIDFDGPVLRQSEHLPRYRQALAALEARGLVYPCFCSRADIAAAVAAADPRDPEGAPLYPGTCRSLSNAARRARIADREPYALRLDMTAALATAPPLSFSEAGIGPGGEHGRLPAAPERWGDVVLARKDIRTSYHLAVVLDDAMQEVTTVTRGHDLFHATGVHRLLQHLFGLPEPLYHHHRLIGDDTGRKLSKSAGDRSLRSLRQAGVTPQHIRQLLSQ
jgi:glutamyl-Q tRNA(Asp) synthetase